jgi:hypothetical protein
MGWKCFMDIMKIDKLHDFTDEVKLKDIMKEVTMNGFENIPPIVVLELDTG